MTANRPAETLKIVPSKIMTILHKICVVFPAYIVTIALLRSTFKSFRNIWQ